MLNTHTLLTFFLSLPLTVQNRDFPNIHIQTLGVTPIDAEFERGEKVLTCTQDRHSPESQNKSRCSNQIRM